MGLQLKKNIEIKMTINTKDLHEKVAIVLSKMTGDTDKMEDVIVYETGELESFSKSFFKNMELTLSDEKNQKGLKNILLNSIASKVFNGMEKPVGHYFGENNV